MCLYLYIQVVLFVLLIFEFRRILTPKILFVWGAIITFIPLGLRNITMGGDTLDYYNFFINKDSLYGTLNNPNEDIGFVYTYVCRIIHFISSSKFFFILSTSLMTMFPFYYLIKIKGVSKILPLFLYMYGWGIMSTTYAAFRQNLATSFVLWAFVIFTSKRMSKMKKSFFIILLLSLSFSSHHTTLIIIPLLFIIYYLPTSKKIALVALGSCFFLSLLISTFAKNFFTIFFLFLSNNPSFSNITKYGETMDLMDNSGFLNLAPLAIYVMILILASTKEETNRMEYKCLVWGECIYLIGISFPLTPRMIFTIMMIGIVYSPHRLFPSKIKKITFKNNNKRKSNKYYLYIYKYVLIILLFLFLAHSYLRYLNYDYSTDGGGGHMLPYSFIWE